VGKKIIIAMDGPAGVGKSTAARRVAEILGYAFVDTGAIYRCVAWLAAQRHIPWTDGSALGSLAQHMRIDFVPHEDGQRVFVDDQDVTLAIRTREISQGSSTVSAHSEVRSILLALQRKLALEASSGAVLEGRDIGTVIFPDAAVKFFLTARPEVRAKRRYDELQARGILASLGDILHDVQTRDLQDAGRAISPMRPAEDAEVFDTSVLSLDEVVGHIVTRVRRVDPIPSH
jgi:cytidylate kinase